MNLEKAVNKKTDFYNLRFERKFVYPHHSFEQVLHNTVYANSFQFKEVFHKRSVNNIYFDDHNFTFYKQNVSGVDIREKYRLRWYGEDFYKVVKPTLEIKKKFGDVGDKISFKLKDLEIDLRTHPQEEVHRRLLQKLDTPDKLNILLKLQGIFPSLYNSYDRRYFLSECERFRITLDYNMKFFNPNFKNFMASETTIDDIVLELKYSREYDDESRNLSQEIDERLSKNSKYVRGIEAISY